MKAAISRRSSLAVSVVACLLLGACDQTGPATVRQEGAAPATSEKAAPIAVAPSAPAKPTAANSTPAQKPADPPRQAPSQQSPVTATLRPEKNAVRDGDTVTLTVDVQIAPGWHIYAVDRPTGVALPTKIRLELPAGLESRGKWTSPEPALDDSSAGEPAFVYHDAAAFQQTIRVKQGAAVGPMAIRAELSYQVCDRFSCRAPTALKLQTSIQIVP
jgi:DsbC/DsbD-like thiol-disulfide interchange protein